jgi:hypothetical protein
VVRVKVSDRIFEGQQWVVGADGSFHRCPRVFELLEDGAQSLVGNLTRPVRIGGQPLESRRKSRGYDKNLVRAVDQRPGSERNLTQI